ncbi:MBOAT family protein [Blautia schinkii]|nr:MBOAT family protein [Blautia schinkii]
MVFSSIIFLFYFLPVVLTLYYTAGKVGIHIRNILLLFASLFFYAWGEPVYVILLIGSCALSWISALCIHYFSGAKKLWLIVGCIVNVGILFIFKYLNFSIETANTIFRIAGAEIQIPVTDIMLPIGISFYTFQGLSYIVDVYREEAEVQKNPFYVALYISFFPQLIAGPIVRYTTIADQILNRTHTWEKFEQGAARFVIGLSKKILLANTFAVIADTIYELTMAGHQIIEIPILLAWIGALAYTLQIFFDFSAYSDMAIGLGKMFGFTFEENFNYPYMSKSVGEFWRRWHISLSTWFREYVYFPLGGSRVENPDVMVRNLFIVWLLTGIWHGAAWTFIFWGLLNFLCILLERLFKFQDSTRIPNACKHIYAMFMVNMGWVLFRSENFYQFREFAGNMFGMNHNGLYNDRVFMFLKEYAFFWIAGILLCFPFSKWLKERFAQYPRISAFAGAVLYPAGLIGLFGVSVIYLVKGGYNPFIYFNF